MRLVLSLQDNCSTVLLIVTFWMLLPTVIFCNIELRRMFDFRVRHFSLWSSELHELISFALWFAMSDAATFLPTCWDMIHERMHQYDKVLVAKRFEFCVQIKFVCMFCLYCTSSSNSQKFPCAWLLLRRVKQNSEKCGRFGFSRSSLSAPKTHLEWSSS